MSYDLFMLVVLISAAVLGAWKGLAWQVASLGSLVLSYVVALRFRGMVAPMFGDQEPWNNFAAMLMLYLVTSLAIWLVFRMVSGFIDRLKLKEFDRQLGAMFGLAKGALICTAVTFFAVTLSESMRQSILSSRSGYYIALFMDRAHAVMPEDFHNVVGPYIHSLDDTLDPSDRTHQHGDHEHATAESDSSTDPTAGTVLDEARTAVRESAKNAVKETASKLFRDDDETDENRPF